MFEKVIRDNVHGDIYIKDKIIWDIISTPEMQRLRRILQLGGSQFAFPSATHTRFSHSIGTYYVVSLFLENENFAKAIEPKEKLLVQLAGLMHDLGHGAFSHTFELITTQRHEQYTADIINNKEGNIYKLLIANNIDPNEIVQIINGTYKNNIINMLVSSQLDADRLDYLLRDAKSCGVAYAALEINWIIRHADIQDNKIVFDHKALYAIESYLLGRYHMYKQIYLHNASIQFDMLFQTWFKRVKYLKDNNYEFNDKTLIDFLNKTVNVETIDVETYLGIDDYMFFNIFKLCETQDDSILADLSNRLINRKLFNIRRESSIEIEEIKSKLIANKYNLDYYLIPIEEKPYIIYKDKINEKKDETIYIKRDKKILPFSIASLFGLAMNDVSDKKNEKKWLFPKEIDKIY